MNNAPVQSQLHNVNALAQLASGEWVTFRVGRPTTWGKAQDRWLKFFPLAEQAGGFWSIAGQAIHHFNVRAHNDPDVRWARAIQVRQSDLVRIGD